MSGNEVTVRPSYDCECPPGYKQEVVTSDYKEMGYDIVCTKKEDFCPCEYHGKVYQVN